jgi:hypothetical protein
MVAMSHFEADSYNNTHFCNICYKNVVAKKMKRKKNEEKTQKEKKKSRVNRCLGLKQCEVRK